MITNKPEVVLPEQDFGKKQNEQGLFRKYEVRRTDGSDSPGGKHDGCEYFVLDMTHDPHAKAAAAAYADSAEMDYPDLAADMRGRYGLDTLARPAAAPQQHGQEVVPATEVQKWKDRYFDRRRVISRWHNEAVAMGYDGVADLLACVERGEPPLHIAELLARKASRTSQPQQPAEAVAVELPDVSDAEIAAWLERHDLSHAIRGTDARAAFEDAQSFVLTKPAAPPSSIDIDIGKLRGLVKRVETLAYRQHRDGGMGPLGADLLNIANGIAALIGDGGEKANG